jgi:hypothetical protein
MNEIDWSKDDILFIANEIHDVLEVPDVSSLRKTIEPWLTAVFQSEHLSLLLGTGLTTAVCTESGVPPQAMQRIFFSSTANKDFSTLISDFANTKATDMNRGKANFEDDIRTAIELLNGLEILYDADAQSLKSDINKKLETLVINLIQNEKAVLDSSKITETSKAPKGKQALDILKRFLISFSSRTATRDRLHIFTTNYDRFIEYALDSAGVYILDRFIGKLNPIMRMHKMELDYHYNPPGIRGEPRYVEGVVRYTKLHGSIDWRYKDHEIYKYPLPFGDDIKDSHDPLENYIIYPNSAKDIETTYFPYSELFRDFSSALCRPNSVLVTYGYGFGDSHINRIIADMLTIPSTHLVIISYDLADCRIRKFVENCNLTQLTLLIGKHLGNIKNLTDNYLPKSAIDRISERKQRIIEKRGKSSDQEHEDDKNAD